MKKEKRQVNCTVTGLHEQFAGCICILNATIPQQVVRRNQRLESGSTRGPYHAALVTGLLKTCSVPAALSYVTRAIGQETY
jgi:hypothetical protein